jgi:hypothetical protein
MSEMSKDVTNAYNYNDFTKLAGSLTTSMEKVAVAEIAGKCSEINI